MVKCYIWPVLLYDAEVWTLKVSIMNRSEELEIMWIYRRVLNISWTSTYKLIVVWYKSDELKDVFNIILTEFWPYDLMNGESNKQTKEMYNLMNTIKWAFIGGTCFYAAVFLIPPLFITNRLPYPVAYPFDWTATPWYHIVYFTQAFSHLITVSFIAPAADYMALGILLNISSQYCILQEYIEIFNTPEMYATNKRLREIMNDGLENKYTDERREYFVRFVRHHQLILR
ncbi:uncharacterized protein LOC114328902 [Diabrotica virgifera virgifera]|uniref:Uncharacterized protein n=1 Tax=Diabrotica virgifera virgifera TaxID=50390 RepID=A0ABM5K5J4_DIAVI|nr:uncharacterized protein LOC114328902 [Diabrotica virgifera virgifera]